jgi:3-methyladenine DNA glycosylase Tag
MAAVRRQPDFTAIEETAIARHGSAALAARLPEVLTADELRAIADDRYLSAMSLRIFRAGLRHALVDAKWPAFEEVFLGFDPGLCATLPDEAIEAMLADRRLIRSLPKLRAVRANAGALRAVAIEHGSFGAWIAPWPGHDITGLWAALAKRFEQLGGNSAPVFLRMVGKDTFLPTEAVRRALEHWGAVSPELPSRELTRRMGEVFAAWHTETGKPLAVLSQTLAHSVD